MRARPGRYPLDSPILVAADVSSLADLDRLVGQVVGHVAGVKLGLEVMHACGGPQVVEAVMGHGVGEIFYDAKLDDIPNTVERAVKAIAGMGVTYTNVMASAGLDAIKAAVDNCGETKILVVTVLTSLTGDQCFDIYGQDVDDQVRYFAEMAAKVGAHGLISSAKQLPYLRKIPEVADMMFITPGVRSPGTATHDQSQVETPAAAMQNGAYRLVVGREITQAEDPAAAADRINDDVETALDV